jgi:Nuclear RNA-splicing-associated protein
VESLRNPNETTKPSSSHDNSKMSSKVEKEKELNLEKDSERSETLSSRRRARKHRRHSRERQTKKDKKRKKQRKHSSSSSSSSSSVRHHSCGGRYEVDESLHGNDSLRSYDSNSSTSSSSSRDRSRREKKKRRRSKDKDSRKDSRKDKKRKGRKERTEQKRRKTNGDEDPGVGDSHNDVMKEAGPAPEGKDSVSNIPPSIAINDTAKEERRARMVPMSREEFEKEQSVVREVYDDESGRWRLVRGSGEIIERIVSRDDHLRINQRATRGDGSSFSKHIFEALGRR